MTVGFVVAMESEYEPFLSKLGALDRVEHICSMDFCVYNNHKKTVILAKCGIGSIAAATAASLLIGRFACTEIFNYGLVGSLGEISVGVTVAVKDVVHYDSDLSAFGHPIGAACDMPSPYLSADEKNLSLLAKKGIPVCRLASGDKFIANDFLKSKLRSDFSADICDMEGAGIALVCCRTHTPFTMIKLVSDGAGDDAVSDYSKSKLAAFDLTIDLVLSAIKGA